MKQTINIYFTAALCSLILSCNSSVTKNDKVKINTDTIARVDKVRHRKFTPLPSYDTLQPPPLLIAKKKKSLKKEIQEKADSVYEQDGYVKATVFDHTGFDGCSFMIQLENGKILEPNNLATAFKIDGLQVWLKYESCPGDSICMVGDMICVNAIVKRSKILRPGNNSFRKLKLHPTFEIELK